MTNKGRFCIELAAIHFFMCFINAPGGFSGAKSQMTTLTDLLSYSCGSGQTNSSNILVSVVKRDSYKFINSSGRIFLNKTRSNKFDCFMTMIPCEALFYFLIYLWLLYTSTNWRDEGHESSRADDLLKSKDSYTNVSSKMQARFSETKVPWFLGLLILRFPPSC